MELPENANPVGQVALNFMRLKDPKIDAALEEGRTNPDQAARKAAYDKVWQRFAADVPYAWLSHARISVMWSGKVHGVGEGTLPDGTKPLLFRGAIPTLIPLGGIWLGQ